MLKSLIRCLSSAILLALLQPNKAAFFQRTKVLEINSCFFPAKGYPVRTWLSLYNLTSTPITKELKECSFICNQDQNCLAYQVVRLKDGHGFCQIYQQLPTTLDVGAEVCKSFMKREKQLDCVIRWNPINFKTRTNMDGFRVEKADKSWSIYNNSRGIHIIGLNSTTCQPYSHNVFDTVASASERKRFTLSSDAQVSTGSFLIGYSVGDFYDPSMTIFLYRRYQVMYGFSYFNSLAFICVKDNPTYCWSQDNWAPAGFIIFVIAEIENSPFVPLFPDDGQFLNYLTANYEI